MVGVRDTRLRLASPPCYKGRRTGQGRRVFGLSLGKILVTILIIVAIWKGFTLVNRLAGERKAALRRRAGAAARAAKGSRAERRGTVELRPCPRCGAYVDPGEGCHCGVRRNEARRANS
jgi:hypothetical protein